MLSRIAATLVSLLFVGSCSSGEEVLFDEAAFSPYTDLDGPAFVPIESVEAVEIVWIDDNRQGGPFTLTRPDRRCLGAADREQCIDLIEAAAGEVAVQEYEDRTSAYVLGPSSCPMCAVSRGYVFIVDDQAARPVGQREAIESIGLIDAPGEAVLVLGRGALVRPREDGFELVTTSQVCNPEGPERTLWTVEQDGSVTRGMTWMENLGHDCSDE